MAAPSPSTSIRTPLFLEFPELSHLSRDDLQDMLADPMYFQAVFHSLGNVRSLYQAQAELGMANESIAKNNLALQDRLYQTRSETQSAFEEAKALETRWRELEREQKELHQRFTPQFLLMRLRHATTAQDDLSEARASTFVGSASDSENGVVTGREVDEFVKEFRELRATYHKRVMWGDKWTKGEVQWHDD